MTSIIKEKIDKSVKLSINHSSGTGNVNLPSELVGEVELTICQVGASVSVELASLSQNFDNATLTKNIIYFDIFPYSKISLTTKLLGPRGENKVLVYQLEDHGLLNPDTIETEPEKTIKGYEKS